MARILTTTYNGNGTLSYSATGLPTGLSIDNSTGEITGTISGTADVNSPYAVTVTATDGTNTSTQTINWTVNPVVTVDPIDDQSNADGDVVSLQVSAEDSLNNTLTYSATGLPPGLNIDGTSDLISGTISAGADTDSPYAVTVTATDSAGLSASQSFNWTVTPVGLVNPGPQASVDDQAVSVQLQGSSGASYTATGLPSGVSINSSTGLISGTLASNADASSPYIVTATATLGSNNLSQTFVWTVTPIGLAAVSDQTNTEGDSVSLQVQGLSSGGSLTYSAAGLPDGLSIDPSTGLITGTIAAGDAANGPYTVDVAVTNGTVSASQCFYWTVNPIVNLTAPPDQTNTEGDNVSLQATATDALNNTLSYSADGLPSSLSINSTTGLISGTIATGDFSGGPYAVTVTASDETYSSSQTFTWNILQANPTTPTLTNPGTQTNVASDSVNLQVNASDADGDALNYSATNLPDGLEIDPNSGVISGIIADDAPDSAPYQVTATAADGNGISASQTFSWLVNAPALNVQGVPVNAVEGVDPGSFTVATFTTPDLNSLADDFTATIDFGDGNMDTGVISGSNGSFTVTTDNIYAQPGTYTVTVQLDDSQTGGSAIATTTATVTVAPLTATGGFDLGVVEQQATPLTLATFTSANPNLIASNFTATIDWGDGSGALSATVIDLGDGLLGVSGSHVYALNGAYTATISITGSDGSTASTTSTVTVGNLYAGIPSKLTVASFTDSNTSLSASSFAATINWGDGTQSSGTVVGSSGTFQVQGTHTYAQDSIDQPYGVYTVMVTVSDPSGDTLTSSSAVAVVRPNETLDVANVDIASSLTVSNVPVAVFTVPDGVDAASEFSAQIAWGDGNTSSGTIQEVSPGLFQVLGSHTYAAYDWYTMTVTVLQGWGGMAANSEGAGEVGGKPIVLVNQNYKPAPTLSVASWTNSFTKGGQLIKNPKGWPQAKGAYFVSRDPARFYVQVEDKAANKNPGRPDTITVDIASSNDTGHTITLTETGNNTGIFRSQALLLTTFSVDKKAGGNQTLNALLGDTVVAIDDGQKATATVPVKKVVTLHINILTQGGNPVASVAKVMADVGRADRIYAPVGILFEASVNTVNPPAKVNINMGLISHFIFGANWDSRGEIPMTPAERNLLDAANLRTRTNNDIEVYYINYFSDKDGNQIENGYGESFPASLVPAQYANSIIISANNEKYQTLAHEIGHILLNNGKHDSRIVNLMAGGEPQVNGTVTDSRRIPPAEVAAMLKSKLALNPS